MSNQTVNINIQPDENGFIGRECPKCKMYFKVKPGTGLKNNYHICPYCDYKGPNNEFFTKEQIEYAKSAAIKKVLDPIFDNFYKNLKKIETKTKGGFIQIKVTTSGNKLRIKKYQEKILETSVKCDNCGCVFSIYGVFSNCPDCGKLNVKAIFDASIEVSNSILKLSQQNVNKLKEELMKTALLGAVSAFDAYGKEIRKKYSSKFPSKPKNLFQNFNELDRALKKSFGKCIKDYLSPGDADFLFKMFQVRHIYEHYSGVIDDDFVKKIPQFKTQKGRKYILDKKECELFLDKIQELANKIYSEVK